MDDYDADETKAIDADPSKLLRAASHVLWGAAAEEQPRRFEEDDELRLIARRLLELAGEHVDAVTALREACLYRPALAVLRGLLEVMSTLAWLAADPDRYAPLFLDAKMPPRRNVLERIGWSSQVGQYAALSELVHPSEARLHMYRNIDTGHDGLFPEVVPDGEMYVLVNPAVGQAPYVSFTPMPVEDAHRLYGPYVAMKALDLALAGVIAFYGIGALWPQGLWPNVEAQLLASLLLKDKDLAAEMACDPDVLLGQQRLPFDE